MCHVIGQTGGCVTCLGRRLPFPVTLGQTPHVFGQTHLTEGVLGGCFFAPRALQCTPSPIACSQLGRCLGLGLLGTSRILLGLKNLGWTLGW